MKIITVNGVVSEIPPKVGSRFCLSDLKLHLKDTVEIVMLPGGNKLAFGKTGQEMRDKRKLNKSASSIFTSRKEIYGDVVYISREEDIDYGK